MTHSLHFGTGIADFCRVHSRNTLLHEALVIILQIMACPSAILPRVFCYKLRSCEDLSLSFVGLFSMKKTAFPESNLKINYFLKDILETSQLLLNIIYKLFHELTSLNLHLFGFYTARYCTS